MNNYIDIQIQPDAEMRENVLLNKVYTKLHKSLYELKSTTLGVSFPRYQIKLGDVIRIHGNTADIEQLQSTNWLGGLSGYCEISPMSQIPDNVEYRTVSRKQTNMSPAKLRRLTKRGSIATDDAKKYKAKMFSQSLDNPYLELESSSNGHKHRRFIEFGSLTKTTVEGNFDQFGLSKTATIPWF
jgi:CRISPR-associated endonuclease Csy4